MKLLAESFIRYLAQIEHYWCKSLSQKKKKKKAADDQTFSQIMFNQH